MSAVAPSARPSRCLCCRRWPAVGGTTSCLACQGRPACSRCGKAPKRGYAVCERHRREQIRHQRARYLRRRLQGLCPRCGRPGPGVCGVCRAEAAQWRLDAKMSGKWDWRDRRERFLAKGLCTSCGVRKQNEGRQHCEPCLERARVRNRVYYRARMEARRAA